MVRIEPQKISRYAQALLGMAAFALAASGAQGATTNLADQPIFTAVSVPGNVALTLSVEYPTATSIGNGIVNYSSSTTYLGYFSPNLCYVYNQQTPKTTSTMGSYFTPYSTANSDHSCTGATANSLWSGNFLNWATHSTIDPFRWAMTGGYRSVDTASLTILEKAWSGTQASATESPAQTTSLTSYPNITPFSWSNITTTIFDLGQYMCFTGTGTVSSGTLETGVLTGTITSGGSKYKNGTYSGVSLTGGGGSGATANITVSGGAVTSVTVVASGTGYVVGNVLSASNSNLGNGSGGAGFTFTVATAYGTATYTTSSSNWSGTLSYATEYSSGSATAANATCVEVRVEVCNASAPTGVESFCTRYPAGNYKPTGLIQANAQTMRFADFGYLLDSAANSNVGVRDGAVMRARMKYVGPTMPVPGSAPITNPNAEWNPNSGIFVAIPDPTDVTNTQNAQGCSGNKCTIANSGVINYLNMFGEHARSLGHSTAYKGYDNVSELYYTALRYFKELGDVPEYSALYGYNADLTNSDCVKYSADQCVDGFPVIAGTNWYPADASAPRGYDFPVQYYCQKNFILGIGDANTHQDENVPGTYGGGSYLSQGSSYEPPLEALVSSTGGVACVQPSTTACSDTTVDATKTTNWIGNQEGTINGHTVSSTGQLGQTALTSYTSCCGGATYYIAGLAYDAHVNDMLPKVFVSGGTKPAIQTLTTYWVDVLEYGTFYDQNQYWMATKYGGFTVPSGYTEFCSPVSGAACNATTAWPTSMWASNGRTVSNGSTAYTVPDNYYSGRDSAAMVNGLTSAFASIAAATTTAGSTGLSVTTSKVNATNNINYSADYNPGDWTGDVQAASLTFDSNNVPIVGTMIWSAQANLATQLGALGVNYLTARNIVTWNDVTGKAVPFRNSATNLSADEIADLTPSTSAATADQVINYLRGDQSQEGQSGAMLFRARDFVLGDIVDSQVLALGPPQEAITAQYNNGYSAFQTEYANRKTVVYVGGNDGMLHAFDGSTTDSTAGQELWAYVPGALYAGPALPATPYTNGLVSRTYRVFTHYNFVDGTPMAADVDFNNAGGSFSSTPNWHSILVGGLGKGGRAYYAIDVTNPATMTSESAVASNVLWEFNQSTINNCPSTVCHGSTATIGYSFGQPVVTKTAKYGWVVILSSGYDNADGIGYLFLVNPKTGALLEAPLSTGVGSAGTPSGLAQFTTFVPNYSDGTSDSIYAADLLGNVWRVDLTTTTGSYAAPMLLATADDPSGNPQPITVYPQAEVAQGTLKRYVVFGTGKTLSSTDMSNSQINTIYSIWDGTGTSGGFLTSATLPNGITYPIKRSELQVVTDLTVGLPSTLTGGPMGWYIDLAAATGGYSAEQIDVQPAVDLGVAMFGINVSGGAVCDPNGTGRVDEFNIGTAMSEIVGTSGSVVGTFQASSRIISVDFVNIGGSDITGVFSMDGGGSSKTEIIGNGGGTYGNNGSIIKSLSFSNSPTSLNWREIKGAN